MDPNVGGRQAGTMDEDVLGSMAIEWAGKYNRTPGMVKHNSRFRETRQRLN